MKKSLCAIYVILFSFLGAKAMAPKLDTTVHKVSSETPETTGSTNDGNRKCSKKFKDNNIINSINDLCDCSKRIYE